MKKIFISGDDTNPLFHDMKKTRGALYALFDKDRYEIVLDTEHFEGMTAHTLHQMDLVVLYNDHWNDKIHTSHQLQQAFVTYIAAGGSLLVLHNPDIGIVPELAHLIGCMPMHPLEKPVDAALEFIPDVQHPALCITGNSVRFHSSEHLFSLAFDPFVQRKTILTGCTRDGEYFPAGWTVEYGLGKTAYMLPGHQADTFENESYCMILKELIAWLTDHNAVEG